MEISAYYEDVLEWHLVGTPESLWGSKEHQDVSWSMAKEECLVELPRALMSDSEEPLADALADSYVTFVPLVSLYMDEVAQKAYPRKVWLSIGEFLPIAKVIIEQQKEDCVLDLFYCLLHTFNTTHLPMKDILSEVSRSNWSKYPTVQQVKEQYGDNLEEAIKAACDHIETNNTKGYKDVVGEVRQSSRGDVVVFRCDSGKGKIMKAHVWFKEPDLKSILEKTNA